MSSFLDKTLFETLSLTFDYYAPSFKITLCHSESLFPHFQTDMFLCDSMKNALMSSIIFSVPSDYCPDIEPETFLSVIKTVLERFGHLVMRKYHSYNVFIRLMHGGRNFIK